MRGGRRDLRGAAAAPAPPGSRAAAPRGSARHREAPPAAPPAHLGPPGPPHPGARTGNRAGIVTGHRHRAASYLTPGTAWGHLTLGTGKPPSGDLTPGASHQHRAQAPGTSHWDHLLHSTGTWHQHQTLHINHLALVRHAGSFSSETLPISLPAGHPPLPPPPPQGPARPQEKGAGGSCGGGTSTIPPPDPEGSWEPALV